MALHDTKLAHNVGSIVHPNYNSREQILACQSMIGFDGIYKNVYENRDILSKKAGFMFVMGDYFGKDNSFDLANVPKLEEYCTLDEVLELCEDPNSQFMLGWHTWSHRDLTTLSEDEIMYEITPPMVHKGVRLRWKAFAYPHGTFNDDVIFCIKKLGIFKAAFSVTQGSRDPSEADYMYKIYRDYIR